MLRTFIIVAVSSVALWASPASAQFSSQMRVRNNPEICQSDPQLRACRDQASQQSTQMVSRCNAWNVQTNCSDELNGVIVNGRRQIAIVRRRRAN
ncbi:MAG: hypothetical protein V4480_00895 [Patescibacteria group bacterium]